MFVRRVPGLAGIQLHSGLIRLLRHCNLIDLVFLAYVTVVGGVILVLPSIRYWEVLLLDHALVVGLVLMIAKTAATFPSLFWRMVHFWYPAVLTPVAYRELYYLVRPPITCGDYDQELIAADRFLFGVDPTRWLEQVRVSADFPGLYWPPLVEWSQWVYTSFFFIPVSLGVFLCLRRRWAHYEEAIGAATMGFYTSYLGYFFIPAVGPRSWVPHDHPIEELGLWFTASLRETLDALELPMRDCFPSGHVEVTLIVLAFAWRFHRPLFWFLLPISLTMVFATVYLRYHYVVDVIAGAVLAAIVVPAASACYRRWEEVRRSLAAA